MWHSARHVRTDMGRAMRRLWQTQIICWILLWGSSGLVSQADDRGSQAGSSASRADSQAAHGWTDWKEVRGVNYVPSYARNATEIWTRFNAEVVDRELGFARRMGFNTIRFFVDVRAYEADSKLMLARLDQFLDICQKYQLRTIPQLFDSCGVEEAELQEKRALRFDPKSGKWFDRHWRTWTSNPGFHRMGREHWAKLEEYIQAVVGAHRKDRRILLWDVVNEPWCMARWNNPRQRAVILRFIEHFCKEVKNLEPEAPITVGLTTLDRVKLVEDWIDVVTFHMYQPEVAPRPKRWAAMLNRARQYSERSGKPILITEWGYPAWYMQGGQGRRYGDEEQRVFYETILPIVEKSEIGWCIFDLIMGYGPFAHISLLRPNGDKRPAARIIEKVLHDR